MKRNFFAIIAMLCVLLAMGTGFTRITRMTVTVGGGEGYTGHVEKAQAFESLRKLDVPTISVPPVDVIVPARIPVKISMQRISQGCGGIVPGEFTLNLGGNAHVKYDPATGESFFRLEGVSYDVVLNDGQAEPMIEKVK